MSSPLAALVGPVDQVAPLLLGAVLSHGEVSVRITEVEAYGGADDPGSHAFRGQTRRNASMFAAAGRLYCYFTYGMHVCANVVTGPEGVPSAVLLRAGEVISGPDVARERRPASSDRDLARGPARLCRALAIGLDHDGVDLGGAGMRLRLAETPESEVSSGPRVGLRGAPHRPWRFWTTGARSVSTYRAAVPRRGR